MMSNYKNDAVPRLESFAEMSRMNKEKTLSSLKNKMEIDRVMDGMYIPEKIQSQMRKKSNGHKRMAAEHTMGGVFGEIDPIHDTPNRTHQTQTSYHNQMLH